MVPPTFPADLADKVLGAASSVAAGIFLNPNEPVVGGGRVMLDFLPSSPLLLPTSDGERCMLGDLQGALTFSEALASSVLPAEGESNYRYDRADNK